MLLLKGNPVSDPFLIVLLVPFRCFYEDHGSMLFGIWLKLQLTLQQLEQQRETMWFILFYCSNVIKCCLCNAWPDNMTLG